MLINWLGLAPGFLTENHMHKCDDMRRHFLGSGAPPPKKAVVGTGEVANNKGPFGLRYSYTENSCDQLVH